MKCLALIFCLTFGVTVANAQKAFKTANGTDSNPSAEARLELSTSVIEQRYSVEEGSRLLRLMLNLTYSNVGNRPILLDKKSSLIYRQMLSRNLKAVSHRKYEYDVSFSFIDVDSMHAAGMQMGMPEKEAFILLKPGESYVLKKEVILSLYDGTKDTEDSLRPGTHFLQLRVATWYYFADPDTYREKWREEGYVWSQNMTSMPMAIEVKKQP